MEKANFCVVSKGTTLKGFDPDAVRRSIMAKLGVNAESADKVLASRYIVVKKDMEEAAARQVARDLRRAGLDVALARAVSKSGRAVERSGYDSGGFHPFGEGGMESHRASTAEQKPVRTTRMVPLEFRGEGREYFKIWLVNVILSVLTLGVYSAWAKVRRKQYLYGSTRIQGCGFEYLADPVKILKGRALVVVVALLSALLQQFLPFLALLFSLSFVAILPWLIVQSLAFNARNSAFRNIRFGFHGSYLEAAKVFILWPMLAALTLGILFPYVYFRQKRFIVENHSYGTTRFSFDATSRDYYRTFLGVFVPGLAGFAVIAVLAVLYRPFSIPAAALLYFGLFALFSVKTTNLLFSSSRIGPHRLSADLTVKDYLSLVFTNTLGTVLTFGMFHPWAQVRALRYKMGHIRLVTAEELDGFVAAEQKRASALAEEAGDFLDLDVGL